MPAKILKGDLLRYFRDPCLCETTFYARSTGVGGYGRQAHALMTTSMQTRLIMARLAVALACAAGVSAFMAPSVTAPAKTVVYGKGGELRDRKLQCWILHELVAVSPPLHRRMA